MTITHPSVGVIEHLKFGFQTAISFQFTVSVQVNMGKKPDGF